MNVLQGTIQTLHTQGNLTLVKVAVADLVFTSIIIETSETVDYLKTGHAVQVMFKETEVIICKEQVEISMQNRIPVEITDIEKGKLLSRLSLKFHDYSLCSIITTNAVLQLGLQAGHRVIAMVKTNEIMLAK